MSSMLLAMFLGRASALLRAFFTGFRVSSAEQIRWLSALIEFRSMNRYLKQILLDKKNNNHEF